MKMVVTRRHGLFYQNTNKLKQANRQISSPSSVFAIILRGMFASCFCVFLFLVHSPVHAAEDFNFTERLVGKWEGKWDDTFGVKFNITKAELEFAIDYSVEEVIGEPYNEQSFKGKKVNSNTVIAGALVFVVNKENREVYVVGIFEAATRIATLEKVFDD
jgi:hypothetical protein